MLYQKDAHHYRKKIQRKRRGRRAYGVTLLVLSLALMFYAVPCFAVSIWDDGRTQANPTAFSSSVSDSAYTAPEEKSDETVAAAAASSSRVYSKVNPAISETTGPGILDDEAAVIAAKKRAQAVTVANLEKEARAQSQISPITTIVAKSSSVEFAVAAFVVAIAFAILGIRLIAHDRASRGNAISASFSSALRA